ncbi:MAG: hypothetical protein ACOVNZ_09585 [Crocinitomicaceae bacterium]
MPFRKSFILLLLCFLPLLSQAQESSWREYKRFVDKEFIHLDTSSIYPNSLIVVHRKDTLKKEQYSFDFATGIFELKSPIYDTLNFKYQVFPFDLTKSYKKRDTTIIYNQNKGNQDLFKIENKVSVNDIFGGNELNKNGSISRGVSFGNNQDLGINSSLNLELSGNLAPNLKVLASVSDANLPIQPDGNTNKLQEFDQVFIQVYNDNLKVVAGDFWINKPTGYFLTYRKRGQGLTSEYSWLTPKQNKWQTQVSAALSKGKFNRQIIQGIESNQGPYRLIGAENEPFILILAGTERIYIDGKLLQRGQEFDYVIDYNSSELTFTSRNLITKDSRIVAEFQYSDQNYARSLVQNSTSFTGKKVNFWFNAYSEQDAKNQSLQQELSGEQKLYLSQIGDDLSQARISSIDSVGFIDNQILYKMIDSLGYDSVLVFTVNPDSSKYRASFQFVGSNKGDYVLSNYNALGKVFKWVEPISGIPQGDYAPSRLIITPKKKQLLSSGIQVEITPKLIFESEAALSTNDINTFSKINGEDDQGYANRTKIKYLVPFGKDSTIGWKMESKAEVELLSSNFSPIEQYRKVEFDRDWNTRNKGFLGSQTAANIGTTIQNKRNGFINLEGQHFAIGKQFSGNRLATEGNWKQDGWSAKWDGSALTSRSENANTIIGNEKNSFFRHRADISKDFKYFKIGYIDDHERNDFRDSSNKIRANSYQFFDYQFYFSSGDSSKTYFKLFYRERYDQRADSIQLKPVAKAITAGGELKLANLKNQRLNLIGAYRSLLVSDTVLLSQTPENSMVGRIEYEAKWWKNALTWNTFYEVGSGLEQKREFQYLKVNDGQGIYTWVDYNGDGIKDLNEFEIAQYVDQASYIRIFIPSNTYINTYSNEFNQSVFWRPERIWSNKKGLKQFLSRFSDQARLRINRKLNEFDPNAAFNPLATEINDQSLVSTSSTIKNSLFFNRTSSVISAEYSIQDVKSKTLLATGFDSKRNASQEFSLRWNIRTAFSIEIKGQIGIKESFADYTIGRNYRYDYKTGQPSLIFQPSTNFRISLDGRISKKQNAIDLGSEKCDLIEIGSTLKYNQTDRGSLQGEFKMVQMDFTGNSNSAVGFELLESLRPGTNYTWNFGYQRNVSKNLQLTIQYLGRKSEDSRMIHSGNMEVRAFF